MDTSIKAHPSVDRWFRVIGLVALCLVIGAGVISAMIWTAGAERRAVERLSPDDRREVFARTWQNFRELCAAPAKGNNVAPMVRKVA